MSDAAKPKKSLGQHWLNDDTALTAILEAAKLNQTETVLEIGPGLGSLTKRLLPIVQTLYAVELDPDLVNHLKTQHNEPQKLHIIQADILQFDLHQLPPNYTVVANIPYYLTSQLLRVLCESTNPFSRAILLVQKEVAERVVAQQGNMSLLSVSVQFYADVELGPVIPAELFTPPPKVDSQVLLLNYTGPKFSVDTKRFFQIVKTGFSERRKKLRSSLSGGLGITKAAAEDLLMKANLDPNKRAQALSLEDWLQLYQAIQNNT